MLLLMNLNGLHQKEISQCKKAKGKDHPVTYHEGIGEELSSTLSLTSDLGRVGD